MVERGLRWSAGEAEATDADFVGTGEEVRWVGVDPVGASPFQLLAPVAAGHDPDADRARPARGEQIPHTVADHEGVLGLTHQQRGRGWPAVAR